MSVVGYERGDERVGEQRRSVQVKRLCAYGLKGYGRAGSPSTTHEQVMSVVGHECGHERVG